MKNKQKKIEMLKGIETLSYQIANYLLDDVDSAVEATKQTLLRVMSDGSFFQLDESERTRYVHNMTVRHSLRLYSSYNELRHQERVM